jgi:hypothetical protein
MTNFSSGLLIAVTAIAVRVTTSQIAMAVVAVTRIHIVVHLTQSLDIEITHVRNVYKS